MGMLGKVVMAIGAVILILGIVIAIIPVNERQKFSASEFSVVGNDFIAPSVSIPPGVVVTVSWETDSWELFGTPSCALAMKDSSGDYDVLASDEGKSGSFTYTTIVGGDYYILQRGMTVFTSGTVSISFTYFPGLVMGGILLIVGMIIVIAGSVLHKRSKKVTVIYTQTPPMQQSIQPQYPPQSAPYPPQYPPQPAPSVPAPPPPTQYPPQH
jgi:hypothetical protein